MTKEKDLRSLSKTERMLKVSLDNVKEFVEVFRPDQDVRSLELRMSKLDDLLEKFIDVRMKIELVLDDTDNNEEFTDAEESDEARSRRQSILQRRQDDENDRIIKDFENEVYRLKQMIMTFLPSSSGMQVVQGASANVVAAMQSKVKLPELKLPCFCGKTADWVTFRDTYKNLIHNDDRLSSMDKFTYLRTCLSGDALQEIAAIEMSAVNYQIAWEALENLYENKKMLVMTHLDALFALEPLRQESFESLNRLVNGFEKNLQMLSKIGENPDGWSTLLQYMLCKRLHPVTLRQWESHYNSKEVPKYKDLIEFLKGHCAVLQSIAPAKVFSSEVKKPFRSSISHTSVQPSADCCPFCGEPPHSAFKCSKFSKLKISERVEAVRRNSLCLNCLSPAHIARFCTRGSCHHCGQRHHSLLHATYANSQAKTGQSSIKKPQGQQPQPPQIQAKLQPNGHSANTQSTQKPHTGSNSSSTPTASIAQSHTTATDSPSTSYHTAPLVHSTHAPHTVLLSTAVVSLADHYGNTILARALLDSGSQRCYVSENISQKLKFKRSHEHLPIAGIGGARTSSTQVIFAEVRSLVTSYTTHLKFHVLPRVTVDLPVRSIDTRSWSLPNRITLADPTYDQSGAIDLIIGAEVYLELILRDRQVKLGEFGPILQNTQLGWIIAGVVPEVSTCCNAVDSDSWERIEKDLARFFDIESCRTTSVLSLEESACETYFENTVKRDSTGRFVVQLPKKKFQLDRLGESRTTALRRFSALEKRLNSDPVVKGMYTNFIHEYLQLHHMREVPSAEEESSSHPSYYLPHHAVLKPDSTTTKLRVVFDASCATSSGISLNDALMVGPVVQRDLYSIILSFRLRRYALTADIEKMYRMINIHHSDHHLQRIVWRDDPSMPVRTFELTTVTYGTSPAPYLATRCLKRLAEDSESKYPVAARTILHNFYVDDLLKSVDSVEEGHQVCSELIGLLGSAGFTLRKWSSNSQEIIDKIPPQLRDERMSLNLEPSEVKTLGLKWEPRSDIFKFSVPLWSSATEINKRTILSDFAKLFDPLGLVGPVIVQAKVFLQDLWKSKCSWDEPLAEELQSWWLEYRENMADLIRLEVPRWVGFGGDVISVELHGFCDASQKAYGACFYLRCALLDGSVRVSLLTSKSRVAPLDDVAKKRKKISIPRLELSSALVCSHLFEKVVQGINLTAQPYFWTDSMITKCWLSSPPSRWNDFVANRVSSIQHTTRNGVWNHIAGSENPADVLSRGITPQQLISYQIWWQGPSWLLLGKESWPRTAQIHVDDVDHNLLEQRPAFAAVAHIQPPSPIFALRSSLTDLVRIVALLKRFSHNCMHRENRRTGFLSYQEREEALLQLVALSQQELFEDDVNEIKRNGEVRSTSRIMSLTPRFVDGILRVGGRLSNAQIPMERKHPIILDNHHPLTSLIVTHYHQKLFHAGQQLLISSIRDRFWPLSARSLARKIIHRCVKCYRAKPKSHEQLMGDLPVERVTPSPPFQKVGVDYCGPFNIRYPNRKGSPIKCFVAVFVCLAVKAVHLEVVADLSTQSFIAALKRFVSRRGRPKIIMCDNATNFVGARRELNELRNLFNNQEFAKSLAQETAIENINFKFIPARSPNFGGLWEAAVKAMKGHMKRTLGNSILTYDEMSTLTAQIEACLNSRPLTPLSNDPNDLEILTPGHFLINRPLADIPEPSLQDLNESRLSRWQKVQNYLQHIWRRWSTQYLSELNNRTKWTRQRKNLFVGTMVLLREDNVPPLRWRMGRVVEVHTGNDDNVRVVKLLTKDGFFTRGIAKVCILPIADNEPSADSAHGED